MTFSDNNIFFSNGAFTQDFSPNYRQHPKDFPVINNLKNRLKLCRQRLLEILDQYFYFESSVAPRLIYIYQSIFGDLETEIDEKSTKAVKLERRVELLSMKLRQGEKLTIKTIELIDFIVDKEIERREKYKNHKGSQKNNQSTSASNMCEGTQFNDSPENDCTELPHLYRTLVKHMHPDVAGESEIFDKYWNHIQDAYKSKDVEHLKLFHKVICGWNYNDGAELQSEEKLLMQEIEELENKIESEKTKLENLINREPFIWEDKLEDIFWVEKRKRKLREKIYQIDRQIQFNERIFVSMTGKTNDRGLNKHTNFDIPYKNNYVQNFARN
jgi:hypothetical protein